jgi:RimJ/RimL family protein N-acetyltransferase
LRSVSKRWQTLRLRAWRRGDERAFTPRPDMAEDMMLVAWAWGRGPPGPTWTLERAGNGRVVGMAGGVEHVRGEWQIWSVLAPMHWRDWPPALALARNALRSLERDWGARRFTAFARIDFPGAHLVLRRLGFVLCMGPPPPWPGTVMYERWNGRRRKKAQ